MGSTCTKHWLYNRLETSEIWDKLESGMMSVVMLLQISHEHAHLQKMSSTSSMKNLAEMRSFYMYMSTMSALVVWYRELMRKPYKLTYTNMSSFSHSYSSSLFC